MAKEKPTKIKRNHKRDHKESAQSKIKDILDFDKQFSQALEAIATHESNA